MLLSAEKGVTNDGTIVHYKSEATGREKKRMEQLFTVGRKTEKKEFAKLAGACGTRCVHACLSFLPTAGHEA